MSPLRVTAKLASPISLHPDHGVGLDSMLIMAAAVRSQRARAIRCAADLEPIDIPVQTSECGRYYLASFGTFVVQGHQARHIASPAPVMEYRKRSDAASINAGAGADKSFRVPLPTVVATEVTWWCVGDRAGVHELVARIPGLGRRHGAGMGEVFEWTVEQTDAWQGVFPVLDPTGAPTRPVPLDTKGLGQHDVRTLRLMPPYWMADGAEQVAVRCGGWA